MEHNDDPKRDLFKRIALYTHRQKHSNQTASAPITSTQMSTATFSLPPPTRFVRVGKGVPHPGVIAPDHQQAEPTSPATSPSARALDFDHAFELLVRRSCAH